MISKRPKVAVVGSINMDIVINSFRLPEKGETIIGSDFSMVPGGKGANQAITSRRLGADVEMIGCVGDDEFGKILLKEIKKENVGINNISIIPNVSTGIASITVSEKGDNIIVVSPGANHYVTPTHVDKGESIIKEADILLLQMEIPLESVQQAIKIAKRNNTKIILNPAPAQELPQAVFENIDYITPNETESIIIMNDGKKVENIEEKNILNMDDIIRSIKRKGKFEVILTGGKNGVYYSSKDTIKHQNAYHVNVKDTTAAGDSFNGALGVMIGEGHSLDVAINYAQKVAAITCTVPGAIPSLPYRYQVDSSELVI